MRERTYGFCQKFSGIGEIPKPLENRGQSQPVLFEREGDEEGVGKLQLRLPLLRGPSALKFMLICK